MDQFLLAVGTFSMTEWRSRVVTSVLLQNLSFRLEKSRTNLVLAVTVTSRWTACHLE